MNFSNLSQYQPREFVDVSADLTHPKEVSELFQGLLDRPINSAESFDQWLSDLSELSAVLDQQASILYIQMTCHTDNSEFVEKYKNFIQEIMPAVKPLGHQLDQRFLKLNQQFPLDANRYRVFERDLKADVQLFFQENIPLEIEVQMLSQEYQGLFGAMTVDFLGETRTLQQMGKFQEETNRDIREQAWRLSGERRLKDSERFEGIFEEMLHLRDTIARNAGFGNFMDYQFKAYHRFDYRPEHCRRYHEAVKKCVVPIWGKILNRQKERLGVETLRPWDLHVDPLGRSPLRPFGEVSELISGVQKIFQRIDPVLGGQFQGMADHGLLELESRKGKAPGGYQNTLAEAREPFIFMNAVGMDSDVRTLLHEGGHAFHTFACAHDPLYAYRHAPMEFCEIASMTMELLGNQFLDVFYNKEEARRSVETHLENIIYTLVWVANIDAFQHWIYEHPGHSRDERLYKWDEMYQEFNGPQVDWSGLEYFRQTLWHRQLHIFEVPFYYIEYGIAQLGALQIWQNAKADWSGALQKYKKSLALGGSRTLPELFATAGVEFDFSEQILMPLVDAVVEELNL